MIQRSTLRMAESSLPSDSTTIKTLFLFVSILSSSNRAWTSCRFSSEGTTSTSPLALAEPDPMCEVAASVEAGDRQKRSGARCSERSRNWSSSSAKIDRRSPLSSASISPFSFTRSRRRRTHLCSTPLHHRSTLPRCRGSSRRSQSRLLESSRPSLHAPAARLHRRARAKRRGS